MSRLLTEGFELKDLVNWYLYVNTGLMAAPATTTAQKRSGTSSMYMHGQSNDYAIATRTITSYISEGWIRVGIYLGQIFPDHSSCQIQWVINGTVLGSIRFDDGQPVKLYVGTTLVATGSVSLTVSTWYLIEVHVDIGPGGMLEVKIDEVMDHAARFVGNTQPGADTTFNSIAFYLFGSTGPNFSDCYWDDIGLNDPTGIYDNSWCGNGKIVMLAPNGTIAHALTGSDGDTVDNHLLIDDVPHDSDTTYVKGTTPNDEDLYSFADVGAAISDTDIITRVWAQGRAKDMEANGRCATFIIKPSGGSETPGLDYPLFTSYIYDMVTPGVIKNPVDGENWQIADLDDIQAGVRIRT